MQTFETPQPTSLQLDFGFVVANIRIHAGERTETTVDVRPVNPSAKADVRLAEQTRIEFTDGVVTVRAPKLGSLLIRTGSVDVTIEVPSGSDVEGSNGMGEFIVDGQLGRCRWKTGYGEIRLTEAGSIRIHSSSGDVTVGHVTGEAEITASNGALRVEQIDGTATLKSSNGQTWVGDVAGDIRVNAANGSIAVDRAGASVVAKTANGGVRVGGITRGAVSAETAAGAIDLGIRAGTSAWLELNTVAGRVRNELDASAGPDASDQTVEIRAHTYVGDIVVHRA